jgi:DNA-directed RNA polymerase subunit RPC12/RpoP
MAEVKEIRCPVCGFKEVSKPYYSRQAIALSFLLLGFPLPFLTKKYHCFDCGADFKKKNVKE